MSDKPWLHPLEDLLAAEFTLPLYAQGPPFPPENFVQGLQLILASQEITFSTDQLQKIDKENFTKGLGSVTLIPFTLLPIDGTAFLLLPENGTEEMIKSSISTQDFEWDRLKSGYTHYLFLQILSLLTKCGAFPSLFPQLADETTLPEETSFALTFTLTMSEKVFKGRLLLPVGMYEEFKKRFPGQRLSLRDDPAAADISLPLTITLGTTRFDENEIREQLTSGDWVAIEMPTQPLLCYKNIPLFYGSVSENNFTIKTAPPFTSEPQDDLVIFEMGTLTLPLTKLYGLKEDDILSITPKEGMAIELIFSGKKIAAGEPKDWQNRARGVLVQKIFS